MTNGSWNIGPSPARRNVPVYRLWALQDSVPGVRRDACYLRSFLVPDVISSGAPAADFDRMVWGARIAGVFFLADDYIDSGKMLDRIPGFKKAATGAGVC